MISNNFKTNLFLSAWKKYMPAAKILIKKSADGIQVFRLNRSDFEKDSKRKYGYKFTIHFSRGKPLVKAKTEIMQSFVYALMNDEVIAALLLQNDYSFTLNGDYELEIKNDGLALN